MENNKIRRATEDNRIMVECAVGLHTFDKCVDITDPCYDKGMDGLGILRNVPIVGGHYVCVVWMWDDGTWGPRVGRIGIYLDGAIPSLDDMTKIGYASVDAGLCGFFENQPNYADEWEKFCDSLKPDNKKWWILPNGFFSNTGFGDGSYDVYAHLTATGQADALEVCFM